MSAPEAVTGFVDRLIHATGTKVVSLVYSPLPFTEGQLLTVCAEEGCFIPEVVTSAYGCDPPELVFHWLRASELRQLAMPLGVGTFFAKNSGGYAGHSYWLKHEGEVLWGADVRSEIPVPENPRELLRSHLLASTTWTRNHKVLNGLANGSYSLLIEALGEHTRRRAATALLLRGVWRVTQETVFHELRSSFGEPELQMVCSELENTFTMIPPADDGQPVREDTEELAYKAAWTYERLVACLRKYIE